MVVLLNKVEALIAVPQDKAIMKRLSSLLAAAFRRDAFLQKGSAPFSFALPPNQRQLKRVGTSVATIALVAAASLVLVRHANAVNGTLSLEPIGTITPANLSSAAKPHSFASLFVDRRSTSLANSLTSYLAPLAPLPVTGVCSGTRNIPGDYATLAAAITDINTNGVLVGGGGCTLNLIAGNPQTAPAGGYSITTIAGTSASDALIIQGNGNTITASAALAGGALNDSIFKLIGADWVTIQGFTMQENAANTSTAGGSQNMTEWGVALLYATTTNGAQNNTIQNNTITLNRTYQNTFGIYANATHSATAVTTSATATGTAGGNSGLKIYSNNISNVNNGIVVVGPTAAADNNNGVDIGGASAATANTITNFGTTGTFSAYANVPTTNVNGILVRNSTTVNISFNTVTSSVGGTTVGALNGIHIPASSNAPTIAFTNNIISNNISLQSGVAGATGAINGINSPSGSASATSTINIDSNNFNTFGHTVAASGVISFITNASTYLNSSIDGNTFTNLSVNTTGNVTFISNAITVPAGGTQSMDSNSIVTAFAKTGAGGTITGITSSGTSTTVTSSSNNNNFSNITATGSTAISLISNSDGGSVNHNITGNTINNISGGTLAITGITSNNGGGNGGSGNVISGNTITNINCACAITGISVGATGQTNTVTSNTIGTLFGGAGSVIGITSAAPTNAIISKNKIYDLQNNIAAGTVNGIAVTAGTQTVSNNLIGDLRTTTANTANPLIGLNVSGGTTVNVYYNTVYLNATSSGATFGSSAISASTTPTLTLRNNVLVNLSTPNGAGLTVAYRRSSNSLTNYAAASNNNDFYAGTPGASRLIFNDGTNSDQTIAAYKTRVSPRDSASVTESPTFLSTTGSNANFLHINPAIVTLVESRGVNIALITDDFDGQVRQGNAGYGGTGSAPDIGADEFEGIAIDITPPVISYTNLSQGASGLASRNFTNVTVTDATGVNITAGTRPRVYYKKSCDANNTFNDNTNATVGWKFAEANGAGGSPFSFTIDYSLLPACGGGSGAGVVDVGDIIQYFVVAQDTAPAVNVGINSGAFATTPSSVALTAAAFPITGTINSYNIVGGLAGTKTVCSAGSPTCDYGSLTNPGGVFADINAKIITGNLTINIDSDLTAETGAVALNQTIEEPASNFTITFVPTGVPRTISGSATAALIKLNGADRITIDGSLSAGTDRSLTIINTSTGSFTAVVWLSSAGTGAGASNNIIKNCNLAAGANETLATTSTFGIISSGTSVGVANDGADNDNNSFANNSITTARYGIFLRGAAANANDNNVISSNLIGPAAFGANEIGTDGIVIQNQNLATVTQNEVRFVGGDFANRNASSPNNKAVGIGIGSDIWTVNLPTVVTNSTITRNLVHDIVDENAGSAAGIVVAGTGTPSSNVVANNMVYNVHSNGASSNQTVGIGIGAGNGDKVVFNTVSLTGDLDPSGAATATQSAVGIRISSVSTTNLTLKNNIVSADLTSNTPGLHHFAIVAPSTSYSWGTGGADNNDYYVNIGNPQMVLGGLGTATVPSTEVTSLSAWRTQFTPNQDAASQNVNPPFVSASNLHLLAGTPTTLESGATPISGITDDFDADTREVTTPDVGADEGAFTAAFANDVAATAFIDPANGGSKQAGVAFSPQASFSNAGTSAQTNVLVRYRILDPGSSEVYNQTTTIASLPFGATATATFPTAILASGGTHTIFAKAELAGDGSASNDEISGSITVVVPVSGSHMVGTGQEYSSITTALSDLNTRGVSGPVTLLLTSTYSSGGEAFPITINPILGATSTNTITIKPATSVSPTISGSSSCIVRLNSADFIVIDGSNTNGGTTRDLTITNTSTATNTAAVCLMSLGTGAGATNNTIKNTNISAGVDQAANSTNTSFAIESGGAAIDSDGLDNDSNTFTNNFITKARYGIYLRGSAGNLNDNNAVSGNLIGPGSFGASEIGVAGIALLHQNAASVTQNEVGFVGSLFAQTGFENSRAGIAIGGVGDSPWQPGTATTVTNSSITRNLVHDIVDEKESSAVGIILAGTGLPSNNVVANNMLYNIRSNGTLGDQAVGIGISNGSGDKVVFNSVSLTGDLDPAGTVATTGSAAALRINSSAVSNLTLKDNVFSVNVSSNTSALKHYTIEAPASSYSWGTGGSNNNDFYFNAANTQMALGGLGTPPADATFATVTTLTAWKTTFTPNQDGSSISADPLFTSATNLHISSGSPASLAGTVIPGVTIDFDGETRNVSTPDIGADERIVNFSSSGNGNLPAGTYNNVVINSPDAVTLTGNISVNGCVTVNSGGTLNLGNFILSGAGCFTLNSGGTLGIGNSNGITTAGASGNIQLTGARTYNTGANYTYNGSSAQVTGNGLPSTINNLTISNVAGVTLSQDVTVNGLLTLGGDLTTTNSFVLIENGTSSGTGDVVGTVRRTDVNGTPKDFGNPNVEISNGGTATQVDVMLVKGTAPSGFPSAVLRTYTLTETGGDVSGATVQLRYLDPGELNGNTEGSLTLYRAQGTPALWVDQGFTARDGTNNWVRLDGINGFSSWTLANGGQAPTVVKLTKFGATSFADGVQLSWESGFEVDNLGYHLYRERQGKRTRVTPAIVAGSALTVGPGSRLTAGYSYSWFDPKGTADTSYYLEAIDLNGARQWTGPIYPFSSGNSNSSPRRQRALLLSELADSSRASGTNDESAWPAAMSVEARREKLNLTASGLAVQQSIASGEAIKIQVNRTGWHRLSQPELVAAGFDPTSDARLLQLYVDGAEVPIELSNNGPHLDNGDTLEFYGVGLDTPTTDTRTYWLITGSSAGKRIPVRHGKPKEDYQNWTDTPTGSFAYTVEKREKLVYLSHLLNGDADNIFGAPIFSEPVQQTLSVNNLDGQSNLPAQLEIALQGLTEQAHQVQVQFNGSDVGTVTFSGVEHPVATLNVNRALLHTGDNEVSLVSANGDLDISFIDSIRLTYAHQYRADNNTLAFSVAGGQAARVGGFTTPNIRLIDVTNPSAPLEVATNAASSQGGYAVVVPALGNEARTLLAFTDDLSRHPASVIRNSPSNWNASTNGADLVIITHKNFQPAIEPLATLRRNQGLSVAVVDVEDVYDEFSYGAHTPVALKSFLARAALSWSRKPAYLLLVGDSTWDPRNYLDQGFNDFVPTKLIDTGYMETGSDDWFADFNSSGLPSMAIGRLPARTPAEVNLMVAKILTYEQERELNAPLRGAVMVADNGFENQSGQTAALLPSGIDVQTINRSQVGNDDLMRGQIVNALNQGPMIVNYYGHGSVGVWTGEALLDVDSVNGLTNTNRLSLYLMMTCLNGYSHDVYVDSLGESALKAPNGGAVAVWASSGFTEAQPQFEMDKDLYLQLFGAQPIRLGEAMRNAKAAISDPDVRRTWILLGDPTMRMR